jgi:hypothetical protein
VGIISDAREIRAADQLVEELQQRLGGEDPLDPQVREMLDCFRTDLAKMREQLGIDADPAIGDCAEELEMMRGFIAKTGNRSPRCGHGVAPEGSR